MREKVDNAAWKTALLRELKWYKDHVPDQPLDSIFFGGGTPSLMSDDIVGALIDEAQKLWGLSQDAEITLEANPSSYEQDKFRAFRSAGVNRVSLGVQSFDDQQLQFLGRKHTSKEALQAVESSQQIFDRSSFDLIYALPGQSLKQWEQQLRSTLNIAGSHLSLYQLTIEPGTPFKIQHDRGDFYVPDQDIASEFYDLTQTLMHAQGLSAYEVSNHAAPGQESRHNIIYWDSGDYIGIGPGAHGRVAFDGQRHATRTHRAPEIWMEKVMTDGHGLHPLEPLSRDMTIEEILLMGVRMNKGVSLKTLEQAAQTSWGNILDLDACHSVKNEGLLDWNDQRLWLTHKGILMANAILSHIIKPEQLLNAA